MSRRAVPQKSDVNEAVLAEYRLVRGRILEQRAQVERLRALVGRLEEQVVRDERFLASSRALAAC